MHDEFKLSQNLISWLNFSKYIYI